MDTQRTLILDNNQVEQKIQRIAYQIYENNVNEERVVVAGILPRGFGLAKRVAAKLEEISSIKTELVEMAVDKDTPYQQDIKSMLKGVSFESEVVVLVDDVLNSGKTLMYGVKGFLHAPMKKIRTAVLVDRNHSRYPIKADFVGLSLATTLQEHVSVEVNEGKYEVYLE